MSKTKLTAPHAASAVHGESSRDSGQKGLALIVILFMSMVLLVTIAALLTLGAGERTGAVNETDHLQTLGFAEAGLTWAVRRIKDSSTYTDVLNGPNNANASDDYLVGLRSLGLTASSQFTSGNEGTASAVVQRNFFGTGNKNYELIRLPAGPRTRAHVYVRVDDNYDDSPDDQAANVPAQDRDRVIWATAVAEYPVFVNANGAEMTAPLSERGRGVRMLRAAVHGSSPLPAIATDGDLDITSTTKVCGACGGVHSNQDLSLVAGLSICKDATASGALVGITTGVAGTAAGGHPPVALPVISPYDEILVPTVQTFDTASSATVHLRCDPADSTYPGRSKYFALVIDNSMGKVFKAYYDFTNSRWTWKLIDDLSDLTDVQLDDCGRAPGDFGYGAPVSDGLVDQFYGWRAADTQSLTNCATCASASKDASLCDLGNNNFGQNGYFLYPTGAHQASITGSACPRLPGGKGSDTVLDFNPTKYIPSKWDYGSDTIYSPLYHAVLFVYGSAYISGNPGNPSSADYCSSGGCTSTVPGGRWQVSIITAGDIQLSGNPRMGPAAPNRDFHFMFVAGRDVHINGNLNEGISTCASGCSSTAPAGISGLGGIIAAHEQFQINGNPNIFGFSLAENAIDCSSNVDDLGRGASIINGTPKFFYDCNNPPNPWSTGDGEVLDWHEVD